MSVIKGIGNQMSDTMVLYTNKVCLGMFLVTEASCLSALTSWRQWLHSSCPLQTVPGTLEWPTHAWELLERV